MFGMFLPPPQKKRRTNEEIAKARVKQALGLDLVEDAIDVTHNVIDSAFSILDD